MQGAWGEVKMGYKAKLPIELQVVIAMLLIQLIHKIVREIPGSLKLGGPGWIITSMFSVLLVTGIVLTLFRKKAGLILGIICGAWMTFQPIYVHIIMALPDQNGIWWYPIFPWIQAILIIYFCVISWRNKEIFTRS